LEAMMHSPEVMNLARALGDYLSYHYAIGNTLSEFVILITAREWSQDYEWYVHYPIALKAGIAKDIADAIADGRRPTEMNADEEIVYDLTTEILKNKRISDATFQRAEQRFGKKGVVDMVGIAGYYTFLAMQLNMARYQFSGEGLASRVSRTDQSPLHTRESTVIRRLLGILTLLVGMAGGAAYAHGPTQPPHQLYRIGDIALESGEIIKDFSISYVTHGTLNANKSNPILMVTAITAHHHRLDFLIGPGKALDTNKYFVICTDAIANGLTTSPSNSMAQPRMKFPKFLIRDMVASQHKLLTEHLGINHVIAVIGPSMGGM